MTRETLSQKITKILQLQYLLTAPAIIDFLHEQKITCNKTSVYRALDHLFENNIICRHSMGGTHILYGLRAENKIHLVCLCCGKVNLIDDTANIDLTQISNFAPDHRHITIFGKCESCKHLHKACKDIEIHLK